MTDTYWEHEFDKESLIGSDLSHRTALSMGSASSLAYCTDEKTITATLSDWGMSSSVVFDCKDTSGFIAVDDELIILAFRGTESVVDWIRNLKIRQIEVPYGKVHSGFSEALDAVWTDSIEPALRAGAASGKRAWVTGHSLGGALAIMTCARAIRWLQVAGIYTFGQPLVGNRVFADRFNRAFGSSSHRFVNHRDIVARIPPAPFYAHVEHRILFDCDGEVLDDLPIKPKGLLGSEAMSEEDFAYLQSNLESTNVGLCPRGSMPKLAVPEGIRDHDLEQGYMPILRRHAKEVERSSAQSHR